MQWRSRGQTAVLVDGYLRGREDIMRVIVKKFDQTYTTRYVMRRGEGAVRHQHDAEANHFTIFLKGQCLIRDDDGDRIYFPGEIFAPPPGPMHEIIALENGSEFVHVQCRAYLRDDIPAEGFDDEVQVTIPIPEGY